MDIALLVTSSYSWSQTSDDSIGFLPFGWNPSFFALQKYMVRNRRREVNQGKKQMGDEENINLLLSTCVTDSTFLIDIVIGDLPSINEQLIADK